MGLILYLTLALCAAVAVLLVYRHDLYDREPPILLAATVGAGALLMYLAGSLESRALAATGVTGPPGMAFLAAAIEEGLKLLAVVLVAVLARREFNDPMDGLIYGSMAGLGMAVEESVAFLRSTASGALVLPPAEVVRLCGHLVMGGLAGFGMGAAAVRRPGWPKALVGGFSAALGLHFGWDWLALRAEHAGGFDASFSLGGALLMLVGFLVYGALLTLGERWSHDAFAPASPLPRLVGWPFDRSRRG